MTTETVWEINLLGIPEARCGAKTARLRSRRTWCVLAALLLHSRESPSTEPLTRSKLIAQFWPDTENGRVSLRLALASLRANFGEDALICIGDTVRILQARFRCYLFDIEDCYHAACQEAHLERRIHLLEEAAARIRGELLEGCNDPEGSDHLWLAQTRAHWVERSAQVLQALRSALEEHGALEEAFEVAVLTVRLVPENQSAWESAWHLGRATDRAKLVQTMAEALDPNEQFSQIRARERARLPLGRKQEHTFEQLILVRLNGLPEKDRSALLRLSVLTAPFHPVQARQVSGVSLKVLQRLAQWEFLEPAGTLFSFLPTLRKTLWSQIPLLAQHRLRDRLVRWANRYDVERDPLKIEYAKPHLREAQMRLLELPLTHQALWDLIRLHIMEGNPPAQEIQIYLERIAHDTTINISLRHYAAYYAGIAAIDRNAYREAIPLLELALTLSLPELPPWQMGDVHFRLAFANHHAEFIETARFHAEQAGNLFEAKQLPAELSQARRFLGEILRRQGNLLESEAVLREALELACGIYGNRLPVAEFHYQWGVTLSAIGCYPEASVALQEALAIRFENGASTGIADCLSALGALKTEQGRYLEARVDLEYALILYQQSERLPSATATKGLMGNLFVRQGLLTMAQKYYEDGLDFWRKAGHAAWTESFEKRLEAVKLQQE